MTSDIRAERTLALTLVAHPTAFDYGCEALDRSMFSDPLAGRIFESVYCLLLRSQPVTPVSVQAEMVALGKGASVIPAWNKGPTVTAPEAAPLVERIRECWARREYAHLSQRLGEIAEAQGSAAAEREILDALAKLQARPDSRSKSMLEISADYIAKLKHQVEHPEAAIAFDTGYSVIDHHTGGIRVGELFVIAARPSQGKSSFVMGVMSNLARTGVPVGAFWMEDDHLDACRRYHQARHFVPGQDFRNDPRRALQRMNAVAMQSMDEQERIHIDDTHGLSIGDIKARMRRMAREHGVKVFFADHLGEIRFNTGPTERPDIEIGKVVRAYRDTAKELGCAAVLCAQMNRNVEKRPGQRPQMSDLDGSGQIEQAARVIAFAQQPLNHDGAPTGDFLLYFEKNMNGPKGLITLRWVPERMTVENPR